MNPPSKKLLRKAEARLECAANVLGVGFGLKEKGGRPTGQRAWRIYVSRKVPDPFLTPEDRIPKRLFGIPTDVIVRKNTRIARGTSIAPGENIANSKGVPGTLGCLVRKEKEKNWHLLTNAHVLLGRKAALVDPIWLIDYQPDGTYQCRLIAKTVRTKIGVVTYQGEPFFIDGALGLLEPGLSLRHRFRHAGWNIEGSKFPNIGEKVKKIGASSGLTYGLVTDISYPDYAYIEGKSFKAPNQILIAPLESAASFSEAGDSGAVVLDESNMVVGLLWGSNANGEGIACHITPVLKTLGITIEKPRLNFLQKIRQHTTDWFQKKFNNKKQYGRSR